MDEKTLRPRQVTTAGWLIVFGSVAAVVSLFDFVANLRSLDTREMVEETLSEPPFSGLDIGTGQMLDIMHVLALITGAAAAAAAILGWQAMRRQKIARLVLTILAVPLLIGGMSVGGFFTTLVAISVTFLWLQPARDWFNGIDVSEAQPRAGSAQDTESSAAVSTSATPVAPATSATPSSAPPPQGAPVPYGVAPPPPEQRPGAVLAAAIVTWVCSAVMSAIAIVGLVLVQADPDGMIDEAIRQQPDLNTEGVTSGLLVASAAVMTALMVAFAIAASVMAFFALRRRAWARITWIVLVAVAAAFLLFGSIVNIVFGVPMLAAIVTLAFLFRPDTRAWFAGHR